jgi:enediyne biosynthesis protein E3
MRESTVASVWGRLRLGALGIPVDETRFDVRGFSGGTPTARARFEAIGAQFVHGYGLALQHDTAVDLVAALEQVQVSERGFAYEGAGMGVYLRCTLNPWTRIFDDFLRLADDHKYTVHNGIGWALAVLPWSSSRSLLSLDPICRWLAADGWGFHDGFFRTAAALHSRTRPKRLTGYAARASDQGLGRVAWFACCADPGEVLSMVQGFDPARHHDLWAGLGLACAFAEGADLAALSTLAVAAGPHRPSFAQGMAFAVMTRVRTHTVQPHIHAVCETMLGAPVHAIAQTCNRLRNGLPPDGDVPAFEMWRRQVQDELLRSLPVIS